MFVALLFVALVTGAAFAIWIDYHSAGISRAFYTEEMQHAIRVFTVPLPTVVVLGLFFTIIYNRARPAGTSGIDDLFACSISSRQSNGWLPGVPCAARSSQPSGESWS